MAEELFCERHGPYPASVRVCPHCARERGELPPAPVSLYNSTEEYTQAPGAPPPAYSDNDETILPGQVSRGGNAAAARGRGDDSDQTLPPSRGGRRTPGDDDDEKTQPPERNHRRGILDDDEGDVDVTRIKAKEQTGLMGWLIVKSSPYFRRGHIIKIRSDAIFGRSTKKADVIIDDEDVSSAHAFFRIKDEKFIVVDMSSTNGTYVNGNQITGGVEIQQDDEITMGDTVFVLKTLK